MIKGLLSLSTQLKPKVNKFYRFDTLCVACLAPGDHGGLCAGCLEQLPRNHTHCRQCALPLPASTSTENPVLCGQCLTDPPPYSQVIAPWTYRFPVDRLIGQYKYRRRLALGHPLIRELANQLSVHLEQHPDDRPDLLIPSPMHRKRRRQRGYNHAEDITEQLSRKLGIPWSVTHIERHRAAPQQSGLDRKQRLRNLRGSYRVNRRITGTVAIVDDVMTSGATARTVGNALLAAGADDVRVWVLARTPPHP